MFNQAPDAIFLADPETKFIVDCNQTACELLSRSKNEIIGQHQSFLHPKSQTELTNKIFEHHSNTKEKNKINTENFDTVYIIKPNGETIPVEIFSNQVVIKHKIYVQGIFRNISIRKQYEEILKESEKQFRQVFEHTAIALAMVNINGEILKTNEHFSQLFGYNESELVSNHVNYITHPDDFEITKDIFNKLKITN